MTPKFNQETNRLETSIHRIAELSSEQVWQLGYVHVEQGSGRVIHARGVGAIELVRQRGLFLVVNGEPYPRHVDIVGWPREKHDRLQRALEIADQLRLDLDPRPE